MKQALPFTRSRLTTPRAAAVAGILFSILLIICLVLVRSSVPADPRDAGAWLSGNWQTVRLALNLLPFAGISFLWFIGVVRDRLGEREDRFFATVFLGSGLLFLAMLFASAAMAGGTIMVYGDRPAALAATDTYALSRATMYEFLNTYTVKMAGVFMFSTSTLSLRTGIIPRWMAFLGLALAMFLVLYIEFAEWAIVVFPLWVLLISVDILIENYRGKSGTMPAGSTSSSVQSVE